MLFAVSLTLSLPYLNGILHPQTAHVLSSMRAFDERGFFTLRGISTLLAPTPELPEVDGMALLRATPAAAYLSYPPGWLWLPYGTYRAWHLLIPSSEIGPPFLESYGIVFNRFLTFVLLYALLWELGSIWNLKSSERSAAALFGCSFWLLSAPALSMTQNAYGMDEAMLPLLTAMALLLARCRCNPHSRPKERWLLIVVVFLCCFVDWYGWVLAGIGGLACMLRTCLPLRTTSVRRVASVILPFALGAAAAGGIFALQLWAYAPGLSMLEHKYAIRSAMPMTAYELWVFLKMQWLEYLPVRTERFGMFIVAASIAGGIATLRRGHAKDTTAFFVALLLPPIVWTLLLPEHTFKHFFSLLKFSVPTAVGITLFVFWFMRLMRDRIKTPAVASAGFLCALTACLTVLLATNAPYQKYYDYDESEGRWRGGFLKTLGPNEIPLSWEGRAVGLYPTQRAWYSRRTIYFPETLQILMREGVTTWEHLSSFDPVWISTEATTGMAELSGCAGKWEDSGMFRNTRMLVCRDASLRALYAPGAKLPKQP